MISVGLLHAVAAGASLALVSSVHCAAMCGPIALAAHVRGGVQATAAYFAGRLVTYTLLGALAGSFGKVLLLSAWARWAEAGLALLFAASLLYAAFGLLRRTPSASGLVTLRTKPRRARAARALAYVADDALLLGAATALLPCGALFTAVAGAALLGDAARGAASMAAYASLTGLAVVGVAQLAALRTYGAGIRRALGVVLVAGAVLVALRPLAALRADAAAPACHVIAGPKGAAR